MKKIILNLLLLLPLASVAQKPEPETLWYDKPAENWLEALPLGNGSLGAMIFGNTDIERIQFNESTLSTGTTETVGSYQPFGNIYLKWNHKNVVNYKRSLTLNTGVQNVSYHADGIIYKRQYITSHPAKVMLMTATASTLHALNVEILLKDVRTTHTTVTKNSLGFGGTLLNKLQYAAGLKVEQLGGTVMQTDSSLIIKNANSLTLYLSAGTSLKLFSERNYLGKNPQKSIIENVDMAIKKPVQQIIKQHVTDFGSQYNTVQLQLDSENEAPKSTTVQRLIAYSNGKADANLEALVFQYGRYLLISSSRKGGLPANLQGIWNDDVKPAWYSQYTTNINFEMNYWPAEVTNLSSCHFPFFDWVKNIANINRNSTDPTLKTPVGWVAYSTNNIMGGPSKWRLHRPGSAWMAHHFWEHYQFTNDENFLKTQAYPLLKELTKYWQSHLIKNKDGKLISPDGWSPEHGPSKKENDESSYPGASYDQQIVGQLFSDYIKMEKVLKIDGTYCRTVEELSKKLLGPTVGKWGQLQEWMEDVDDPTDHHRHNSHLFAIYPGQMISPIYTPKLAKAAVISLNARGNESTGWSTAWRINIWARLLEGDKAHQLIKKMMRPVNLAVNDSQKSGLYPNLFDAHPPFQIDGNFGLTAGIAEMLLQSHQNEIHLLPALPKGWKNGLVSGLKARGNVKVKIIWENWKLKEAILTAAKSGNFKVRYKNDTKILPLVKSKPYRFSF